MSNFTKKHYEAIAQVIKETRKEAFNTTSEELSSYGTAVITLGSIERKLVALFKKDNSNFKETNFKKATNQFAIKKENTEAIVVDFEEREAIEYARQEGREEEEVI